MKQLELITSDQFCNIIIESTSCITETKAGILINYFEHPKLGSGYTLQADTDDYLLFLGL